MMREKEKEEEEDDDDKTTILGMVFPVDIFMVKIIRGFV